MSDYRNVKIQCCIGVETGFVKAAVNRALCLRECPIGELPLQMYSYLCDYINLKKVLV